MSYQLIYVFWLSPYPFNLLSCYPCSLCQLFIWQLTIWTFKQTTAMQYMNSIVSILHTHTHGRCVSGLIPTSCPPNLQTLTRLMKSSHEWNSGLPWKLRVRVLTGKFFCKFLLKSLRISEFGPIVRALQEFIVRTEQKLQLYIVHAMCNAYCIKIPRKVVQCTLQIA